jgi:peroxiredoxin
MAVEVGQEAPDFELRNTDGEKTKLSDFRGKKNVLLVFYPAAFSPGCESEFCTLRDKNPDLASDENLEVVGISVDTAWTLRAWKMAQNFPNTFVSDFWPHGEVSKQYGAFNEKTGAPFRHSFLIDKQGIVRYVETNQYDLRDQDAWRKAAAELG